jgi:hypothetical protein
MGLFHKATNRELVEIRNRIIQEIGIPILEKKGFKQSPFSTSWYGRDDWQGFTYYLCRLSNNSTLEDIEIQIVRGEKWIKIILNIFKLSPTLDSLNKLSGVDGLQYKLPPNSLSTMKLRTDDIKGPPIFRLGYFFGHKLKSFHTKRGLTRSINKLKKNIETDLNDIDQFVKRWHELHQPNTTNWSGHQITDDLTKN